METGILHLHSHFRWLVLISGVAALFIAAIKVINKAPYSKMQKNLALVYTIICDLQLLAGLSLYFFFSYKTTPYLSNFAEGMKNPGIRFFLVEHIFIMLAAIVMAHIGSSVVKKADTDEKKNMKTMIFYGISILLVLLGIPWSIL